MHSPVSLSLCLSLLSVLQVSDYFSFICMRFIAGLATSTSYYSCFVLLLFQSFSNNSIGNENATESWVKGKNPIPPIRQNNTSADTTRTLQTCLPPPLTSHMTHHTCWLNEEKESANLIPFNGHPYQSSDTVVYSTKKLLNTNMMVQICIFKQ